MAIYLAIKEGLEDPEPRNRHDGSTADFSQAGEPVALLPLPLHLRTGGQLKCWVAANISSGADPVTTLCFVPVGKMLARVDRL